jgi:hypothetical protein
MNALITRRQSRGKCKLASHAGGIQSYGVVATGGSFQKDELNVDALVRRIGYKATLSIGWHNYPF